MKKNHILTFVCMLCSLQVLFAQTNQPNNSKNLGLSGNATTTGNLGTGSDPNVIMYDPSQAAYVKKTATNTYNNEIENFVAADYLGIVTKYADKVITDLTDRWGSVHSPLIISMYNRLEDDRYTSVPEAIEGIRTDDRCIGANPMLDQCLYQLLYPLSTVTGDSKYTNAADASLQFFFNNCQSPYNGLMAWGEHTYWDVYSERAWSQDGGQNIHEFTRPWILWDKCYTLAPQPCKAFADGLWNHQIHNQSTGDFSRHYYDTFDPSKMHSAGGQQFPRHGGFYILTWAEMYAKTGDQMMLDAISKMVEFYNGLIDQTYDMLPISTSEYPRTPPFTGLSLSIDLYDAAALVPQNLADDMLALADQIDNGFTALGHDPDGAGYFVETNVLGGSTIMSDDFTTAYGSNMTHAHGAMICYLKYLQLGESGYGTTYKNLVLETADYYLPVEVMPESYTPFVAANLIALELSAYRITNDSKYLQKACEFANVFATTAFFRNYSELPQATTTHLQYETITQGDALMAQLLDLWMEINTPQTESGIIWVER